MVYTTNLDSLKAVPGPYAARLAWDIAYNLGDSWDKMNKEYCMSSSSFKVDMMVYPELYLKDLTVTQIYRMLFNLSFATEVPFWNGARLMV